MRIKPLKHIAVCVLAICIAAPNAIADIRFTVNVHQRFQFKKLFFNFEGQSHEKTVTYIKGSRQRDEGFSQSTLYGKVFMVKVPLLTMNGSYQAQYNDKVFDVVEIRQCDLKRSVFLNDEYKIYTIFQNDFRNLEEYYSSERGAQQPDNPFTLNLGMKEEEEKKKLATITATTTVIDTGERSEMFGYTARRIKTVTTWQAEPKKACSLSKARYETDGWYIDLLYGLNCSTDISGSPFMKNLWLPPSKYWYHIFEGKYRFKQQTIGSARLGFPLMEMFKIWDESGRMSYRTTEVTELSTEDLDSNLFEVPAGYKEIKDKKDVEQAIQMAKKIKQVKK